MNEKQILLKRWDKRCEERIPKEWNDIKDKYRSQLPNIDLISEMELTDEECSSYEPALAETLNIYLVAKSIMFGVD